MYHFNIFQSTDLPCSLISREKTQFQCSLKLHIGTLLNLKHGKDGKVNEFGLWNPNYCIFVILQWNLVEIYIPIIKIQGKQWPQFGSCDFHLHFKSSQVNDSIPK